MCRAFSAPMFRRRRQAASVAWLSRKSHAFSLVSRPALATSTSSSDSDGDSDRDSTGNSAGDGAGAADETAVAAGAPEGEELTQTDHLNRKLLQAFLQHINTTRPEGPTVEEVDGGVDAFADVEEEADEPEEEDEAALMDAVEVRLQREPSQLRASAFATSAFPRDVVEIAGAGSVSDMIAAMQQAQTGGDSTDEEDEGRDTDADVGVGGAR